MHRRVLGLCLTFFLLLTGCIPATELNDRAIIQALGVDYDGNHYRITVQFFNPTSEQSPQKSEVSIVSGNGSSIASALAEINQNESRELYFGHNSLIAIGKRAVQEKIEEILDHFNADQQTRADICIFMTENAEEIVRLASDENTVPAVSVLKVVQNAVEFGTSCDSRMYQILRMKEAEQSFYSIPYIVVESKEEEPARVIPSGMAVLSRNQLQAVVGTEETRGMQWIFGNIRNYSMIVDSPLHTASIQVNSCESQIKPIVYDHSLILQIKVRVDSQCSDNNLTEQQITSLKSRQERKIKQEIQTAIDRILIGMQNDLFEFGAYLRWSDADFYQVHKEDWMILPETKFDIQVVCDIA